MTLNVELLNDTLSKLNSQNADTRPPHHSSKDFYTGLTLALMSSFFIGSSFIIKKKGLLKLVTTSSTRAGQGGYGYLKEWLWWAGLLTMGVGELCNFAAYGFAPATLVTPLGALSVLISAVMSSYFLSENLNSIGKIGCVLTAIGSTIMVIHAPKEGEVNSVNELLQKLQDTEFIGFTILSIVALVILIVSLAPRYGNTNILINILICSILGSFTVMACKGLSLGLKEMSSHTKSTEASYLYTYMFAFIALSCIVVQMNYLNKSLDIFNTAIVTTVYYVLFTLFVMIASSILFKELANISFQDFIGCVCGFSTIVCALCLIHFFRVDDNNDSMKLENQFKIIEDPPSRSKQSDGPIVGTFKKIFTTMNVSNERYSKDGTLVNNFIRSSLNNKLLSPNRSIDDSNNNYMLLPSHEDNDEQDSNSSDEFVKLNINNKNSSVKTSSQTDDLTVKFVNTTSLAANIGGRTKLQSGSDLNSSDISQVSNQNKNDTNSFINLRPFIK